ncbi:Ferulic acid esterase B [Hyphodiscus hymeniophilus]|uniref:Ferulic acid esterase B n=1 Tax=Hyphodiscus hymeniophilus TaxID=353542 RepID=A0A9P7B1E3_9HELO|nr:Ferulic acid esterase B [Hyphodiscus hymeniophilus]
MRPLSALVAAFALTRFAHGLSSSLTPVDAFVSTSPEVAMWVYVPETGNSTDSSQAIVVAIHSCERTADYYYENTGYASLADQYGYIVIYPNASTPSGCWDTTTSKSTTRNGGGDSQAIVNMVAYAVKNFNGNASRVAVTGSSSGGIMVNLLAGLYPDVFQAASVFSGEYADDIYDYSGSRPKMMIYHGTIDATYPYSNLGEELDGWSSVLDVTFSNNITDSPSPGYTKMVYGDGLKLVGVSAAGVGHTVPVDAVTDLSWFCIAPECDGDGLPFEQLEQLDELNQFNKLGGSFELQHRLDKLGGSFELQRRLDKFQSLQSVEWDRYNYLRFLHGREQEDSQ